ncbi:MAG: helix-turn-helix domain-containing protein [Pseudonocardiaceae bacterium]
MTAANAAAKVGQCTHCSAPLSRYNPNPVCTGCSHLQASPSVPGEWLSRPSGGPGDDAGVVVRAWRGSTGSSQAETARLLGMTQQNLSQIENGRQTMSYEQRQRAVSVLGISAEDLGGWCRTVRHRDGCVRKAVGSGCDRFEVERR